MIEKIKINNIKFRNWSILLFVYILISFIAVKFILDERERVYTELEANRQSLYKCVTELKTTSEKLTSFVRAYVETKEPKYKDAYFDLLKIREGVEKRPLNNDIGYWYYVLRGKDDRNIQYIEPISLYEMMNNFGLREDEIHELKISLDRSNDLIKIEQMAFDAIDGNNTVDIQKYILEGETLEEFAKRILYDDNYINYKYEILIPINDLLVDVENFKTDVLSSQVHSVMEMDQKIFILTTMFFIILFLIIVRILRLTITTRGYFRGLVNQLYDTQAEILNVLARAGEYRDNETGNHVLRVKEYSYEIAIGLGLDKQKTKLVREAAAMHDIGKIGIPDSVLNKPGKYTTEDMEIMKQHTKIGNDIIGEQNIELLKVARTIALEHHEKIDGGGYPHRLKGNEISIYARIVSIADVFDALTSKRVYKDPWSVGEALDYIRSEKGKSFDADIVDAFISRLDRIIEIKEMFKEDTK